MFLPPQAFSAARSILRDWPVKGMVTLLVSVLAWALERITDIYVGLFAVDGELVVVLMTLIIFDTVTGVLASARRDGWETVTSYRLRETTWKMIEYFFLVGTVLMISNASEGRFVEPVFQHIDVGVLFVAFIVEGRSVYENWEAMGYLEGAWEMIREKTVPDSLSEKAPESDE